MCLLDFQPPHLHFASDAYGQALKKTLSAVIASLEREAEERGEALAIGLSRVVQ